MTIHDRRIDSLHRQEIRGFAIKVVNVDGPRVRESLGLVGCGTDRKCGQATVDRLLFAVR